mmetsp:Transcript_27693/g.90585  ORF Transcript_27693/g.90585 Transcript_27693/m.90585 type:complete len:233 (+) Transcript_27693:1471-2169(+)
MLGWLSHPHPCADLAAAKAASRLWKGTGGESFLVASCIHSPLTWSITSGSIPTATMSLEGYLARMFLRSSWYPFTNVALFGMLLAHAVPEKSFCPRATITFLGAGPDHGIACFDASALVNISSAVKGTFALWHPSAWRTTPIPVIATSDTGRSSSRAVSDAKLFDASFVCTVAPHVFGQLGALESTPTPAVYESPTNSMYSFTAGTSKNSPPNGTINPSSVASSLCSGPVFL